MTLERCEECGRQPDASGGPGCACAPHSVGATTAPLSRPLSPPPRGPAPEDLGLFRYGHEPPEEDGEGQLRRSAARHRRRTRRPAAALAIAAAAAAVGAVITGIHMLSGDDTTPLPDERPAPTLALPTGDGGVKSDESASPSRSAATPASPSPSSSALSSSSAPPPSPPRTSVADSSSTAPSTTPSTTPSTSASSPPSRSGDRPVLREGSSGAEVRELQARLKQVGGYGPKVDGDFDRSVRDAVARFQRSNNISGDRKGVYGPATRRALESVTTEK